MVETATPDGVLANDLLQLSADGTRRYNSKVGRVRIHLTQPPLGPRAALQTYEGEGR